MNMIMFLATGIVIGVLFTIIKNYIVKRWKEELKKVILKEQTPDTTKETSVNKVVITEVDPNAIDSSKEKFNPQKAATGLLSLKNPILWVKDLISLFNLRKLIIIGVILSVIYGYGWYKGRLGAPVNFDLRGKDAVIQLNEHYLKIEKDGTAKVVDHDGKVLKTIKVKDVDGLRQALRPYGVDIRYFVTAGGSLGDGGIKPEAGAGIQWFKWFKWHIDSFLTNVGVYPLGVSYRITDNFDILVGGGIGYKEGDKRVYIGGKWKF